MDYNIYITVEQLPEFDRSLISHKPTWSVDSERGYPNGDPSLGVDDDINVGKCMVSSAQPYSWWAVDLGQDVDITEFYLLGYSIQQNGRHGPLTRYVKLWVAHAPGMPGTFFPPPTAKRYR